MSKSYSSLDSRLLVVSEYGDSTSKERVSGALGLDVECVHYGGGS
jgi:hypothetical protein